MYRLHRLQDLHVRVYLLKCVPVAADLLLHQRPARLLRRAVLPIAAATPASAAWTDASKFDRIIFFSYL
jgi:hypothetical protein